MDYNQNDHNNQDKGQWDKWNSNASNSSYYNQPTHRPYGQAFSVAAAICGLLSATTCCTVILSLPLGALGILFAVLAYRKGRKTSSTWVIGLTLSIVGLVSSLAITIYSVAMMPVLMRNETFRDQMNSVMQQIYGIDFTEFMEQYYGYSFK